MSDRPIMNSGLVTLRPPIPEDIDDRLRVGTVPEYITMCGGAPDTNTPYTELRARAWYEQVVAEPYGWCIEVEARCIGTARLHSLDRESRRARYAIGTFDPSAWGRGDGTRSTRLVLGYAFDVLSPLRVDLRVQAYNKRAIACYERCGFRQEGVERQSALISGQWQDDMMMSILEHEYRSPGESGPKENRGPDAGHSNLTASEAA